MEPCVQFSKLKRLLPELLMKSFWIYAPNSQENTNKEVLFNKATDVGMQLYLKGIHRRSFQVNFAIFQNRFFTWQIYLLLFINQLIAAITKIFVISPYFEINQSRNLSENLLWKINLFWFCNFPAVTKNISFQFLR